jgi:hypothetical protein
MGGRDSMAFHIIASPTVILSTTVGLTADSSKLLPVAEKMIESFQKTK